jgi:uncharacterized membrane protein
MAFNYVMLMLLVLVKIFLAWCGSNILTNFVYYKSDFEFSTFIFIIILVITMYRNWSS